VAIALLKICSRLLDERFMSLTPLNPLEDCWEAGKMHSFQGPRRRTSLGTTVQSISTNAQYVILEKYFSHPSFSYQLFFPNPPIKLKLGLQASRSETTDSNPRGAIKPSSQLETGRGQQI